MRLRTLERALICHAGRLVRATLLTRCGRIPPRGACRTKPREGVDVLGLVAGRLRPGRDVAVSAARLYGHWIHDLLAHPSACGADTWPGGNGSKTVRPKSISRCRSTNCRHLDQDAALSLVVSLVSSSGVQI